MTIKDSKKPECSIITIVNKEKVFDQFKASLRAQENVSFELIEVKNDKQQYLSARDAYNEAAKKASGDYLIFLHPDIRFLDKLALHDILASVKNLDNLGVAGVAGTPERLRNGYFILITNIKQGLDAHHTGEMLNEPVQVQTVDECFFVMKKTTFAKSPFSDIKGWHLYAVEQCLNALIDGKNNYVVPARLWHVSDGVSEDIDYVKIGNEIVRRYGKYFPIINTTVYKWETHGIKKYYMPWMHYIDHKLVRKVRNNKTLYGSAKWIKHLFIRP
ncbi:glycosyltransferase [Limosilactobacillus oris]|uniref:glycosyltransferase n=1 Tax=Limosilactobacillus oris TaxID=1632 RepID=UPI00174D469A|nr:glycosyltransferase [Limosilactobacillus oris]